MCVSINYLRCRLVEGVKIFPVCVIDQLSDHFSIGHNYFGLHHATNLQSLYLYTTGKFSAISCIDFAISCNRCH